MSILNQLYNGEIHPEETYRPASPELIATRREYLAHQEELLSELDEQTSIKVRALLEERTFMSSYEIEDSYVQGMRMGAKMAVALLGEETEE